MRARLRILVGMAQTVFAAFAFAQAATPAAATQVKNPDPCSAAALAHLPSPEVALAHHLPTPTEAAQSAAAKGLNAEKAFMDARSAIIEAARSGHLELAGREGVAACLAEDEAKRVSDRQAQLHAECPSSPIIGETEAQLYRCEGEPKEINADAIGSDQLIYSDQLYVYLDHQTRLVTDVQTFTRSAAAAASQP